MKGIVVMCICIQFAKVWIVETTLNQAPLMPFDPCLGNS